MRKYDEITRFLVGKQPAHLSYPLAHLQPVQAKPGKANVDVAKLRQMLEGIAIVNKMIAIQSPEHWQAVVRGFDDSIDAILPVRIPAYPTEVWNSHPQILVERGLPVIFWSLLEYDEPDFWRWAARDMLRTLSVDVHLVRSNRESIVLLKGLAFKRFLSGSRLVVFGEQNFPRNAHAVGDRVTRQLGTEVLVCSLEDMRPRYPRFTATETEIVRTTRPPHLAHCEASGLLEFRDLAGFEEAASRDHVVILYGDHQRDFEILADVPGLEAKVI